MKSYSFLRESMPGILSARGGEAVIPPSSESRGSLRGSLRCPPEPMQLGIQASGNQIMAVPGMGVTGGRRTAAQPLPHLPHGPSPSPVPSPSAQCHGPSPTALSLAHPDSSPFAGEGAQTPSFSSYLYFLFCPTLIYRETYPR